MNVFGVDVLQLIVYVCVAASFAVVIYILKLTRKREEPEETTSQLIQLLDKYVSHQLGIKPGLHSNSSNPNRKRKPQSFPSIIKVDEDTLKPNKQTKKLLERIGHKLEGE